MPTFPTDLTLTADGLTLSRPTERDAEQLVRACRDPEITRFTRVPRPYSHADAVGYVEMCLTGAQQGTSLGLLARDASDRLLASCGIVDVDWDERVAEVGYWVAPWARRQGVATRATRAVCRWAFEVAGMERIALQAATVNLGSNEVARRVGFVHEGMLRAALRDRATDAGDRARFDANLWSLLPGELI